MSNIAHLFPEEPRKQVESRFEEFWKSYPKKVGKPIAKAKFDQIVNGGLKTRTLDKDSGQFIEIELEASADEIIEAAKRYRSSQIDRNTFKFKDDGKYIPHPATWLNQGRFWDE